MNSLYIIATPIGNLNDVTNNLISILESIDVLFCEDTRVTSNLLNLISIKNKPKLISYHKFNEANKLDQCIETIKTNKCALISDAGYPCISDPGYLLVKQCHKQKIRVEIINGPSALMHAIVQSGFSSCGFVFMGFVDKNKTSVIEQLSKNLSIGFPVIFFESVHRINQLIAILKQEFDQHEVYIGRELTKKFETYVISKAKDLPAQVEKGEFCLVINPLPNKQTSSVDYTIIKHLNLLIDKYKMKTKDACKYIAETNNLNATELYNDYIKLNKQK